MVMDDFLIEVVILFFIYIDVLQGLFCSSSLFVFFIGIFGGGVWGGEVMLGGIFDLFGWINGIYIVIYIFIDVNGCVVVVIFDFEISFDFQVSI